MERAGPGHDQDRRHHGPRRRVQAVLGAVDRRPGLRRQGNQRQGQLIARFFRSGLEKSGIQIVSEEVVPRGATTAEPQMQKIRAANPDALFLAGVLTAENVLILRAYRQFGLKFPIHSSYNLSVPVYLTVGKGLVDGVTFVDAYDPDKPEVMEFEAAYRKATGKDPFNMHGYGYDGIMLVAE